MNITQLLTAAALTLASPLALWAADVPGTKAGGRSAQEPPAPTREGNPFPRNPEKPLSNPLRDDKRNLNPQNDPDVERGIKENYERHHKRK